MSLAFSFSKPVLTIVIVLAFHFTASANGGLIKGSVSDSLSNTLLSGAFITLNGGQQIISTDQLGNFQFDGLKPGNYDIRVSHIGYLKEKTSITIRATETIVINVAMVPSLIRLEDVTISGIVSPDETMTTLGKIDIALRPIKSSQDILRMIPGLVTAQHAGGGKAEQIFLRGFDIDHGTDISLTVDGMPVNMVSHAHGQGYADLHFLIPEIIDHVDFNKGPYYSNIGNFNTAGYANFQTENVIDKSSVMLEAGRFDTYRAVGLFDLISNTSKNQNAYLATEYRFTNGPFESPQNFNRINLFGKFSGALGDDKYFTASLSTFKSEWDASGQIPQRAVSNGLITRFGAIDDTEGGFTNRTYANFSLAKFFDDGSSFKHQVYVSNYNFELYSNFTYFLNDSINGDAIKQKEGRNIYGYNASYQKKIPIGRSSFQSEFGVGIRYDDIANTELSHVKARNTFLNPITLGDIDEMNANAFADFTFNFSPLLIVNAGVRVDAFSFQYANKLNIAYDRDSRTAAKISPKLNLYYFAKPNVQVYLKSGFGFHSNDARVVIAQKGQKILPRAIGTDFGLFAKPAGDLLINVAVWQLNLEQEFVYVGDEAVVEASGKTQRYGADLSLRYQALEWLFLDFDSNYAYGRFVDEIEGQNFIPLAPVFTSIAGVTATTKNGILASLRYRMVSDRPANEDNSVVAKGNFLVDGSLTYARRQYELTISSTNIFNQIWNEAQFDTLTRLPGEKKGTSELTFTPGDPVFVKSSIRVFF